MKNILKKLLMGLILVVLTLPLLQFNYSFVKEKPLDGAIRNVLDTAYTRENWLEGNYQQQKTNYLNDHFGFRTALVRLHNQIDFTLFNKANAKDVVIGKQNYLFEQSYINAYYGKDFLGVDSIANQCRRLKAIRDTLQRAGKQLILVLAAGKASFYPEYLPDSCKEKAGSNTNYKEFKIQAEKSGINVIDFNQYFMQHKDSAAYPLYPQYGIHWSQYGAALVTDSIIRYIENLNHIDLPNLRIKKIVISDSIKGSDYDIARGMNLVQQLRSFKMGYPEMHFDDNKSGYRPSVLTIGDSYFWQICNTGIMEQSFKNSRFFYYNNEIYPADPSFIFPAYSLNPKYELKKYDVVMLVCTEANLKELGWGFIEKAYNQYYGPEIIRKEKAISEYRLKFYIKAINETPEWMATIRKDAAQKNISVEKQIHDVAMYMVETNREKTFNEYLNFSPEIKLRKTRMYIRAIMNTPKWLETVRKDAIKNKVSLAQQMKDVATYMALSTKE